MNREIIKYPDPILRKKCQEVQEVAVEIKKLVEEMILALEKKTGSWFISSSSRSFKKGDCR